MAGKYIGWPDKENVLSGVSHCPILTDPNGPDSPIAVFRDAMLLPPASTATPDSICQKALSEGESFSPPRKPRLEEFFVTRFRAVTFTPVGLNPILPSHIVSASSPPVSS